MAEKKSGDILKTVMRSIRELLEANLVFVYMNCCLWEYKQNTFCTKQCNCFIL